MKMYLNFETYINLDSGMRVLSTRFYFTRNLFKRNKNNIAYDLKKHLNSLNNVELSTLKQTVCTIRRVRHSNRKSSFFSQNLNIYFFGGLKHITRLLHRLVHIFI